MPTWRLDIEYDGSRYAGWQKQPHARTVQGELLKAAAAISKTPVEIGAAGRTDAGVHARHQVAHLRAAIRPLPPQQLQIRLNDHLPADINILSLKPASNNFHARHDALMRYYIYQISTRRTALGKPYVWWIKDRLQLSAMQEAGQLLSGRHDFYSFCESAQDQPSTIVEVERAELATSGSLILFRIGASHFLWKMVRRLVGALVEVGRGNIDVTQFHQLLNSHSGVSAAWTAPPSGLFLEKIIYSGDAAPTALVPAFPID
ncbi:MAG: tRNA pseudouridine(38-40) synthase TruA [Acidobacteriota bacterium]